MRIKPKLALAVMLALAAVGVLATAAAAAAPQNTSPPTISGTPKAGSLQTASDGSWSNTPTSFAYQWQRCASDGNGCGDITAGTSKTYTPTTGDVGHTLRVVVTATNADGKASATSAPSDVIGSATGPTNSVRPTVSGSAVVGETLRVTNGSWSPAPSSYSRQWQRCASDVTACVNISGATGATYGVRSADVGHRLRALVTAHSSGGATTVASTASATVTSTTTTVTNTTTTTTTTTTPGNRAPSLLFISLKRKGVRVFARFRICDDHTGRITVIERDSKSRVLSVTRRWHVSLPSSCVVYSKSWIPGRAFRTKGRYAVSLRAVDAQGRLSLLRSRALIRR
jgi:predicted actin-binding protein